MSIKASVHTTEVYTLTLDADAAKWLKGVMKNPLQGQSALQEEQSDSDYRAAAFNSLQGAGA